MPAVVRQIGPPFLNRQGVETKPMAIIATCDVCGEANAAFGVSAGEGKTKYFCGWSNGEPKCKLS